PRREGQERESGRLLEPAESRLGAQNKGKRADERNGEGAPAPGRRPVAAAIRAEHEDDGEREQRWSGLREREPSQQAAFGLSHGGTRQTELRRRHSEAPSFSSRAKRRPAPLMTP